MIEIFKHANYDFLSKKHIFIGLSWVLILFGLVSVLYRTFDGKPNTYAFNMGVDFSGGTLTNVKFKDAPDLNKLRSAIAAQGIDASQITLQPVGEQIGQAPKNEVLVRLPNLVTVVRQAGQSETSATATSDADIGKQKVVAALATFNDPSTAGKVDLNNIGKDVLRSELNAKAGLDSTRADEVAARIIEYRDKQRGGLIASLDEIKNLSGIEPQIGDKLATSFFTGVSAVKSAEAVSPQVGADLRNRAVYVTIVACIGMLAYIAFRFKSWGFGVGAIVAVFHDVLVTLGIFSITQWEINLTVIAALLTLVGYSMNDTIVIFDRIRETMRSKRRESLEKLANDAINQTLSRTIITSGLTFLTVLAMLVFGGEVLKSFSWALFIGIIIGTYSSIYIASPFMIWWEKWRGNKGAVVPAANNEAGIATGAKTGVNLGSAGVTTEMLAAAGVSVAPRKGSKRGQK
jgi:preprotein translocase subunit SecF